MLGIIFLIALLESANHSGPVLNKIHLCVRTLYTAELYDFKGNKPEALPLYRAAARDCILSEQKPN